MLGFMFVVLLLAVCTVTPFLDEEVSLDYASLYDSRAVFWYELYLNEPNPDWRQVCWDNYLLLGVRSAHIMQVLDPEYIPF